MPENLTARRIETLAPPESGRTEIMDATQRGLCYRVSSRGDRTWSLRIKVNGRDRRFSIGEYPAISLAEARTRAAKLRLEAKDGRDPIVERRQAEAERRVAVTVAEVLKLYEDTHLSQKADGGRRGRAIGRALERFAERLPSDLTPAELQRALDEKAKTTPVAANRLRAYLCHLFGWLERRGYLAQNPASRLERVGAETPRDRVLSLGELAAIWEASADIGPVWRPFVRLLMLTAQRRGDLAGMRWAEIAGDRWEIPAARTKTRRPHIVHLSAPVLAELELLRADADLEAELVFTHNGRTPVSGFSKVKRRVDELSGVAEWTLHDLRTAFASTMAEDGETEGVIDRVLNHAAATSRVSTVARVYQRSDLLLQRARCLDRWADVVLRSADEREGAEILSLGA